MKICKAHWIPLVVFGLGLGLAVLLGCVAWRKIPEQFRLSPGLSAALSLVSFGQALFKNAWNALILDGGDDMCFSYLEESSDSLSCHIALIMCA